MKLKKLIAALLGASCMIAALVNPAYAEMPDSDSVYAIEAEEPQYTFPRLPDYIRVSDLADIDPNKDYYLGDSTAVYLETVYKKWIMDSYGKPDTKIPLTTSEKEELEAATAEIVAMVNPSWNDLTKVVFIHDYITSTRCYDTTYSKYSAYNLLVEGTSVCQGYTEAFWYLMYKLDIDCKVVSSDSLNHAWNIVQVNGKWYQIDVTWDDPLTDVPGRTFHNYFLQSDTKFRAVNDGKHNADDFKLQYEGGSAYGYCTDTTYDQGWFWEGIRKPILISEDGYFYNVNNAYITKSDTNNNSVQLLKLSERWYVVGSTTSAYRKCYSGLGMNGATLYYNDDRNVYSCDLSGSNVKTIYTLTAEEQAQYRIYSLAYADGVITLGLAENPNVSIQATKQIPVAIESKMSFVQCLGHSVTLNEQVNVIFYMYLPADIAANSSAYMSFSFAGKNLNIPVSGSAITKVGEKQAYAFSVPVAAAEMTDTITGYLVCGDESSSKITYSVRDYADYVFANPENYAKEIPLVKAMLNYGAASQTYFNHNTESLANDGVSYTAKELPADKLASCKLAITDNDDTLDFKGQVLSLQNMVCAKLYFTGREITAADYTVSGIESWKVSVVDNECIVISDICAGSLDTPISITVGGVAISNYTPYSYLSYAFSGSDTELKTVCAALYDYNEAVKTYAAA